MFWILSFLAFMAAATVAFILFRHWKEIRLLDPDTIRAEQERKVRDRIVRQRFDRRLRHTFAPLERAGRQAIERLTRTVRQAEDRLARAAGVSRQTPGAGGEGMPEVSDDIRTLLGEAEAHAKGRRWAEAERIYFEILKHDSRQIQAYRGLAALYLAQKSYVQAKETLMFLERINGCDGACYSGLAEIAEVDGNLVDTETMRKRAVERSPKEAIRHAELASFYMEHGSPEYAWASAKKATDLEPDNARFLELSVEAAILVRDRAEAERRYDRLRMLSSDRHALQVLRDKIEEIEK